MKKPLLSLAVGLTASIAFAGAPQPMTLGYEIGAVNNETTLSSFDLEVAYEEPSTLTLDTSKKITVVSSEGATFESSRVSWDRASKAVVTFTPPITFKGVYTVFIPEGLFVAKGGTKASTSAYIPSAFTIGTPPPPSTEDVININNINASLPIGNKLEILDPDDESQKGRDGTLIGATGTQYAFTDIVISNENETMFTFVYSGEIYNTTSNKGYIQSISGCQGVYFSETPLTVDNYWSGEYISVEDDQPVIPNGPAKYFYLPGYNGNLFSEIVIKWGENPIVGTVKTPNIEKDNPNDTRSGTIVSAYTETKGATVIMAVKSSTGVNETVTGESGESFATYTITGEPGTTWEITARATKEGFNPSEEVTDTFTIDVPTLEEPEIYYPEEDWGEKMPANGLIYISNPNETGTIYYTVNNGETQSSTEDFIRLRAVGEIGDAYELEAWVEAEGFNPSEKAYIGVYLSDNKLPAPTISPNGGAVLEGANVKIEGNDNTAAIVYRINGGEWNEVECWPWAPVSVTITENCLLEAYASAGDPEEASYVDSEIVSANFVIEKLGENEILIDKSVLGIDMFDNFYTTENVYGKFEYYGWTMDDSINFGDAYYDEEEVEYDEWFRNTDAKEEIRGVKANMANGALAAFFGNEKFELDVELFNDERDDYVVIGEEVDGVISADNGEWLELEGTKFGGYKYFFMRGYGVGASAGSIIFRFGKTDSVQTIDGLTEKDARYYGLDGVEVDGSHLGSGIYIRVLGSKAEKVVVR